jgi:hypothetical protein
VSIYFYNYDAAKRMNSFRDYVLEVKSGQAGTATATASNVDDDDPPQAGMGGSTASQTLIPVELSPTLARARVWDTFGAGVYSQFLVNGAGTYWIKIGRNFSFVAKLQAVFVDRIGGPDFGIDRKPRADMGGLNYWPPAPAEGTDPQKYADPGVKAAVGLWNALDASAGSDGYADVQRPMYVAAYRAAVAGGAPAELLACWRWKLHIWSAEDRKDFDAKVIHAGG